MYTYKDIVVIFRSQALLYILGMIYHDISEYGKMKMENEGIGRHRNYSSCCQFESERLKCLLHISVAEG